ncbi:Flagellar biosynthesis protein FlhB [hydrothermal vent metagenome]|uniref:Flagellar biosynthetic protein FlhB n=1 Tax=hydrothermal vent metagenome TaxID=652676 RepID=A0A3B0ZHR4_9ZZZZ
MAENNSGAEKTEEATPKKLQESRDKGQVARSRELTTMSLLLASGAGFLMLGEQLVIDIMGLMREAFTASRMDLMDTNNLTLLLEASIIDALIALVPFFVVVMLVAFFAPLALSGWSFSVQAMSFKWSKIDPIKGVGRIFSMKGLMELIKALAKFVLVMTIAVLILWHQSDIYMSLGVKSVEPAIAQAGNLLMWAFILLSCATILVAVIDVPFQLWDHAKQLKMTLQEVKDEYKQTEGNPEMKRKVRETQLAMAEKRMMDEVPKADVIITNPMHYAVALKYDQSSSGAPLVVAKGQDLVAAKIRSLAYSNNIPLVEAPPLSRALFYSTELNGEVPAGLYLAVAQVLAFVYQLRQKQSHFDETLVMDDLPIPDDLKRDE